MFCLIWHADYNDSFYLSFCFLSNKYWYQGWDVVMLPVIYIPRPITPWAYFPTNHQPTFQPSPWYSYPTKTLIFFPAHGPRFCSKYHSEDPGLSCSSNFTQFKLIVDKQKLTTDFKNLKDPKIVIMTNERDKKRKKEMVDFGWTLMPCFTAKCISSSGSSGSNKDSSSAAAVTPISEMQQLVAEMAVATESRKSFMHIVSTFWSIIQQLHVGGKEGVEMLRTD